MVSRQAHILKIAGSIPAYATNNNWRIKMIEDNRNDPWAHRSEGMTCATCMWFVVKMKSNTQHGTAFGRCRRHSPTLGGYPAVYGIDWCGDHKLDENRIIEDVTKESVVDRPESEPKPEPYYPGGTGAQKYPEQFGKNESGH